MCYTLTLLNPILPESANMLIMVLAHAQVTGDVSLINQHVCNLCLFGPELIFIFHKVQSFKALGRLFSPEYSVSW